MESDLSLEFLRVVEQAAIACAHTMGQGERHHSDQVAVEAMRRVYLDCTSYEDPGTALAALQTVPHDLVLLDIEMPGMTGFDVCRRLRADAQSELELALAEIGVEPVGRTERLLRRAGGPPVRVFRAPHGFRSPFVARTARRLGYTTCAWSAGVFDTAKPGAEVIAQRSAKALRPGAVLLLHDADGWGDDDRSQTADALPAIGQDHLGALLGDHHHGRIGVARRNGRRSPPAWRQPPGWPSPAA